MMNSRQTTKFVVNRRNAVADLRQRMILLGGGALAISALTLGVTVLFTDKEAAARVKVVGGESLETMVSQSTVYVPNEPVRAGLKLDPTMFHEVLVAKNDIPEGVLTKTSFTGDLYAKSDLKPDSPVMRDQLSATPPLGSVADLIKPGYRAATIEVDATSGVEGWAAAGAHVDIVVTYLDSTDGKKKSQIAIEDAVVLSFNRNTNRLGREDREARIDSTATVTLSLPTIDAVKLHTARSMGKISLILRSVDDVKGVGHAEVTPEDFKQPDKKERVVADKSVKKSVTGYASFVDNKGQTRELELKNGALWSPDGE